jgi:hypothetical protein
MRRRSVGSDLHALRCAWDTRRVHLARSPRLQTRGWLPPPGATSPWLHPNSPCASLQSTVGTAPRFVCPLISYPREVNNIHGQLQCEARPNTPDCPKGAYEGSCGGCAVTNADGLRTLHCEQCGKADGKVQASLYDLSRCGPDQPGNPYLDNQDGVLTCAGISNAQGIPPLQPLRARLESQL